MTTYKDSRERAVTTGTFDGVHRGHRLLLDSLKNESSRRGLVPLAVTFDRHPLDMVCPARAPKLLMLPDRRDAMLREEGIDVVRMAFTEDVMHLTVAQWMEKMHADLGAEMVMIGYDNTFGSDGRGMDTEGYRRNARTSGIELEVAPELPGVSSSRIRQAISGGNVAEAERLLGRSWMLSGEVMPGRKVGRAIGFPTANLAVDCRLILPAPGVYATTVVMPDGKRRPAVTNVGVRPTFDCGEICVETHIPGFAGDLYGANLDIEFRRRIRDEKKFNGPEELKRRIAMDIADACHE